MLMFRGCILTFVGCKSLRLGVINSEVRGL